MPTSRSSNLGLVPVEKMATGAGWQPPPYGSSAGSSKYNTSPTSSMFYDGSVTLEYTQDLHLKMSKKIAQLTKVCSCEGMNEWVSEWMTSLFAAARVLRNVLLLCDVLFIHLSQDGRVDADVTTYASTQVVFISHAAVVTHEKMYERLPWSALTTRWMTVQWVSKLSQWNVAFRFREGRGPWTQHQNLCVWLLHQCASLM